VTISKSSRQAARTGILNIIDSLFYQYFWRSFENIFVPFEGKTGEGN